MSEMTRATAQVIIPAWADLPGGATEQDAVDILGRHAADPEYWGCPVSIGAGESAAAFAIRRELERTGRLF